MSSTIKSTRLAAGISVNELARRLGVTASAVSQLERSESEGTIKLNSLREALAAMGANLRLTSGPEHRMSRYAPYRVAESLAEALMSGRDSTYPLRLLTHAVKELSENIDIVDSSEIEIAPTPLPDKRWDTMMRASFAHALPASKRPSWTSTSRLAEPWFVSDFPALRERARTTTPGYLRRLNIFIDERSLSRA
ncbi:MAG: helix-turn-helix domain-containing protein [Microbacteriaceae bacterium]|nr:helix-turn-helix domain-containing protein [Microbacteriaceae bacterium]